LKSHKRQHHRIEVFVDRIEQLFNSMDPSPFQERDLDDDAEEFIVSWAQEFPRRNVAFNRKLDPKKGEFPCH
jgi:hypothetical protein